MATPFTLDQAEEIAEDFEDLIDTEFRSGTNAFVVEQVMVCPFYENDLVEFVKNYQNSRDRSEALSFYKDGEFDVIVYAYNADKESDTMYIDIRTFVEQKGIGYNFP